MSYEIQCKLTRDGRVVAQDRSLLADAFNYLRKMDDGDDEVDVVITIKRRKPPTNKQLRFIQGVLGPLLLTMYQDRGYLVWDGVGAINLFKHQIGMVDHDTDEVLSLSNKLSNRDDRTFFITSALIELIEAGYDLNYEHELD